MVEAGDGYRRMRITGLTHRCLVPPSESAVAFFLAATQPVNRPRCTNQIRVEIDQPVKHLQSWHRWAKVPRSKAPWPVAFGHPTVSVKAIGTETSHVTTG